MSFLFIEVVSIACALVAVTACVIDWHLHHNDGEVTP